MSTKRPVFRAVPALAHGRGRQLQREVASILRGHFEDACTRAWTEVAARFGTRPLFASSDRSSTAAQQATRALLTLLVNGLGRLTVAAMLLPARETPRRGRRWTSPPPRLTSIPGGLRRPGQETLPNIARRTL
jgi:hypothetical protein